MDSRLYPPQGGALAYAADPADAGWTHAAGCTLTEPAGGCRTTPPARRLFDVGTLALETPPEEARTDFVLPCLGAGECGIVTSEAGIGKSWLTLQIAAGIAIGRDLTGILGTETSSGRVAYLEMEDGMPTIWRRLHPLHAQMTPDERNLLKERLAVFVSPGMPLDVLTEGGRRELRSMAAGRRLVVIDPLAMSHSGDENDTGDMQKAALAYNSVAASTGAAIVVLHHVSKAAMLANAQDSKFSARGAVSFVNAMRLHVALVGMTRQEAIAFNLPPCDAEAYVRWSVPTQHYGARPADVWLKKAPDGFHAVQLNGRQERKKTGRQKKNAFMQRQELPERL